MLGIFVADLAFKAPRLPVMGETILGQGFKDGPGGKGSNQAIAAARAGADVRMITRIGRDTFGEMAQKAWAADGVDTSAVTIDDTLPTGAAFIFVSTETGNNAIIVESGAAANLSPADVAAAEAGHRQLAKCSSPSSSNRSKPRSPASLSRGSTASSPSSTRHRPSPPTGPIYALCDYVTPNETEAATITGLTVETEADALAAAKAFVAMGARNALITLGEKGAFLHGEAGTAMVPAFKVAQGGRYHRRRRRLQRRLRDGTGRGPVTTRRHPLRQRHGSAVGAEARHGAQHADARRDRGTAARLG